MTEMVRAFKSANTIRITIPRRVRYHLNIVAGDLLKMELGIPNGYYLTNPSGEARAIKTKGKK